MTDDTLGRLRRGRRRSLPLAAAVLVVLLVVGWRVVQRVVDAGRLADLSREQSVPVVSAVRPTPAPPSEDLVLSGSVRAVAEAAIYARTTGYLSRRLVDIGARVTAGQLLADIDTPEIDAQYRQADADLATARANSALAETTARRWQALVATDSVSRQEADEKLADAAAKHALAASAEANLARLRDLQGFKHVTAPFAGLITARTIDTGDLIATGSAGDRALFQLADPTRLRIEVDVPQTYADAIHRGAAVALIFPGHPGKPYQAVVARTSEGLDSASRALRVDLELDNAEGELLPGGSVEAHFQITSERPALRVPGSALIFDKDGLRVAVLGDGDRARFRQVVAGRDFGSTIEILSGIGADDRIILAPPDALVEGEPVRVAKPVPPPSPP